MCDATNHNSYGSGLTAVNKFLKKIVYMLDDILFHLPMFYVILQLMDL